MADEKQLQLLKQGVKIWNAWREENPRVVVDLSGANLERAQLEGVNLSYTILLHRGTYGNGTTFDDSYDDGDGDYEELIRADLEGVNLKGATLRGADLDNAHLIGANLNGADLEGADFSHSTLNGANLEGANLKGARLIGANLIEADFTGANVAFATFEEATIGRTVFSNVDLSTTLDLEAVEHHRASTIGIDTLYKSRGNIPEVFLRSCEVPDSFITQARALIEADKGIQFYSCFISYSGADEEFARRLHGRLQQEHVQVWFAPEDLLSGQKLHEQIDEAIGVFDKLLIVLSPNSLKSEWVMTELRKARKRERQSGKRKLFPLSLVAYKTLREWECFDADHGHDLAAEVREYVIPDFTNWKDHDAFETAFARLLKALRATT